MNDPCAILLPNHTKAEMMDACLPLNFPHDRNANIGLLNSRYESVPKACTCQTVRIEITQINK